MKYMDKILSWFILFYSLYAKIIDDILKFIIWKAYNMFYHSIYDKVQLLHILTVLDAYL